MSLRYSSLKIFRFPEKLHSLPRDVDAILPPIHIRIKPTNVCSHHCRYCAYRAPDLQLGESMRVRDTIPRDKMMEIVGDVIAMGVRAVTFSGGGEPLGYPHLLEVVNRLAESPVRFAALTNGTALEGPLAEVFAKSGTWVRVSMDGWDAESYANYRRIGTDEFGRVVGNMERFKQLGGPCLLGVSIVVDRENAGHVYDLIRLVRETGADSIKVSPCIVSNDGPENNRYHEPLFQFVHDQVCRARSELASEEFEIHDTYHAQEVCFDKPYDWCPYAQILSIIGADLRVYTCQDKAYNREKGMLGSIEHVRFRDFWLSDKSKFFGVRPCADCGHHCVADAKNRLVLEYLALDPEHVGFV